MVKYFIDGSGFNGRCSRLCVVKEDGKLVLEKKYYTQKSNNEMEFEAAALALAECKETGDEIYSDSQLVCYGLTGKYIIKAENLKPYFDWCVENMLDKVIDINWIRREKNLAGKYLEKNGRC